MRKIIVAGNWKMNTSRKEAKELFLAIQENAEKSKNLESVLIFPPFPFLSELKDLRKKMFIDVGSQNIASESKGAFTGEVSAAMIKSTDINYTLIGHSERRQYFFESPEILKRKVDLALENDLKVIFCCGELLQERKEGRQNDVIYSQIKESLFHLDVSSMSNIIIAYEPVWAIGTGETATSSQAEEMHAFIREKIFSKYGKEVSDEMHILYGGSCNSANAKELFTLKNVDGGLIGGASLKADEFLKIISLVNE